MLLTKPSLFVSIRGTYLTEDDAKGKDVHLLIIAVPWVKRQKQSPPSLGSNMGLGEWEMPQCMSSHRGSWQMEGMVWIETLAITFPLDYKFLEASHSAWQTEGA